MAQLNNIFCTDSFVIVHYQGHPYYSVEIDQLGDLCHLTPSQTKLCQLSINQGQESGLLLLTINGVTHQLKPVDPVNRLALEAIALVKELGAERWVGFNDGNLKYMAEVKRLAPGVLVFWDRPQSDIDEDCRIAKQHGFEALVLHHSIVTKQNIEQIQKAGIEVGAWTVNDEATMTQMLKMGIDRVYTDDPRRRHSA